jgi:hypothetical protein
MYDRDVYGLQNLFIYCLPFKGKELQSDTSVFVCPPDIGPIVILENNFVFVFFNSSIYTFDRFQLFLSFMPEFSFLIHSSYERKP